MKRALLFVLLASALALGQTSVIGNQVDNGPVLPATCAVGQVYFKTTGVIGLYFCLSANVWTPASVIPGTTINATNNVLPKRSNATTFVDSALSDDGTNVTSTMPILVPNGTAAAPTLRLASEASGFYRYTAGQLGVAIGGTFVFRVIQGIGMSSANSYYWCNNAACGSIDTSLNRVAAGIIGASKTAGTTSTGAYQAAQYLTDTNCSSAASPAVCGSAAAGSVVIAAAAGTVTVNTTAVTANSQIFVMEDASLGTKLSVTCNSTSGRVYEITNRTAATSFIISSTSNPVTNPACLSYLIVN